MLGENRMRKTGIGVTALGIGLGASLGSNMAVFVDIPAFVFVLLVGFGILISAHGMAKVAQMTLAPFSKSNSTTEQMKIVATTGISAFVAAGWIGSLIGVVQLLSALDDPSQIGAGTAVALLTALYGYVIAYAIFLPLSKSTFNIGTTGN